MNYIKIGILLLIAGGSLLLPMSKPEAAGNIKIGTYGPVSTYWQWDANVAKYIASSKIDWIWACSEYGGPKVREVGNILKAANKRIILRLGFWGYPPFKDNPEWRWDYLFDHPEYFATVSKLIVDEIDNIAVNNLYAVTISEEEPGYSWNWDETGKDINKFIYGYNSVYSAIKSNYSGLKVFYSTDRTGLEYLNQTEFNSLKMDGLLVDDYSPDIHILTSDLNIYYKWAVARGLSNDNIFQLGWASTITGSYENCFPDQIPLAFQVAVSAGFTNIGFFCEEPGPHVMLFNDYPEDNFTPPETNQYLHKQAILNLINEYAFIPSPAPSPSSALTSTLGTSTMPSEIAPSDYDIWLKVIPAFVLAGLFLFVIWRIVRKNSI